MVLRALGILGSFRDGGNTDILLDYLLGKLRDYGVYVRKVKLKDLHIEPCYGCRKCLELGECCIHDDMTNIVTPDILQSHILVIASPVYFDNVTSLTKVFMDRTWCLRGKLRNKVLGCVVVGRGYGLDSALVAIHNWALKHKMVIGDRGVMGIGFKHREVLKDKRVFKDLEKHAARLIELASLIYGYWLKSETKY